MFVVVIDDEKLVRENLVEILVGLYGIQAIGFESGDEALNFRPVEPITHIIMDNDRDYHGDYDGRDEGIFFLKAMKKLRVYHNAVFILATGRAGAESVKQAGQENVFDYLIGKPYKDTELVKTILSNY